MKFEWDNKKAENNLKKHQVSLEEGASVFSDALAFTFRDPDHSVREMRYLTNCHFEKYQKLNNAFL